MAFVAAIVVFVAASVAAGTEPPSAGPLLWSCPTNAPDGVVAEPVVAAPGIVAWSTGLAIHAVRLADGTPAWDREGRRRSTEIVPLRLLLPDLTGAPSADATISSLCGRGGRVFATVLTSEHGPAAGRGMLVAVDCSDAAEGRVEWTAALPRGTAAFTGRPHIEGGCILAPVRATGPLDAQRFAAFDLLDGRFLELRPRSDTTAKSATSVDVDGLRVAAAGRSIECRQRATETRAP